MICVASRRSRGILTPYSRSVDAGLYFSPASIANLRVWLKADALALANGANVTSWADQSGNGFTPTSGGTVPTYQTGVINSLPVVRFGGAGYLDYNGSVIATGASACTVFAVAKFNSFASFPELVQLDTTQNNGLNGYQFIAFDDGGMYCANDGSANERYTAAATLATGNFYALTFEAGAGAWSNTNPNFYRNGSLQSSTRGTGTGTPNITSHRMRLGANVSGGQLMNGDVAEILIYNAVLSSTDRAAVESYLIAKYAL